MPDPYPPDGLSPSGPHVHSGSGTANVDYPLSIVHGIHTVHAENHGTIRKRIGRLFVGYSTLMTTYGLLSLYNPGPGFDVSEGPKWQGPRKNEIK